MTLTKLIIAYLEHIQKATGIHYAPALGEFYTDNISILNQFKKEWILNVPGKQYACGYNYTIYIC